MNRLESNILAVLFGALVPMFFGVLPLASLIAVYIMIPLVILDNRLRNIKANKTGILR